MNELGFQTNSAQLLPQPHWLNAFESLAGSSAFALTVILLVSTKNNKVITVMDRDEATSQIFTNINGTIILDK
ncbi:hypothetical protein CN380_10640 [Bacillus sp. AFS017274]|nr:hypothetical protein CN380_10640 [Bacillus sp. AFS017274]